MAKYRVTSPEGVTFEVTAPDDATPDQVQAYAQANMPKADAPAKPAAPVRPPQRAADDFTDDIPKMLPRQRALPKENRTPTDKSIANLLPGAISGAGSIGATLMWPMDKLNDIATGQTGTNDARRAGIDGGLQALGADPSSPGYEVGKVTTQVAGTAAAGPVLGGLAKATPLAAKIPNAVRALETGGFSAGTRAPGAAGLAKNVATRAAGGAVAGGASAGLVNPDDAPAGFAIGGALPPALMAAGATGRVVGAAARGTANAAGGAAKHVLGMTTGVGPEPLSQAFKAGKTGSKDFLDNMRGDVPLTDVLERAKAGMEAMRVAKSAEYRSGMIPIKGDQTVLSLSDIDAAVKEAAGIATFKGQVKNKKAAAAVAEMQDAVNEWRKLDPAQFHTPEGLDALKQRLGGIIEGIPFEEKTARLAASKVYSAAKGSIEKQAPTYAKVMRDYSTASQQITEIERALSLGDKASKDTAMRKLQSLMRNNVQTNYGNRLSLANQLEQGGGVELLPSISGQALNSWTPRSLSGQIGGGATALMTMQNPLMAAALPFQSPRFVGSAAYGLGRMAGKVSGGANALQQQLLGVPQVSLLPNALSQFAYRAAPVAATSGAR